MQIGFAVILNVRLWERGSAEEEDKKHPNSCLRQLIW